MTAAQTISLPLVTPGARAAEAAIAVVSLPFFTPFATCYPLALLAYKLRELGCIVRQVPAHMEFYAHARRAGVSATAYNTFTSQGFAADVALLPLLSSDLPGIRATERDDLARREILAAPDDERRLRQAFADHLGGLVRRLRDVDVICLTSTHYQFVPSLLLAQRVHVDAHERGVSPPRIIIGGYFGSHEAAELALSTHQELDVVVYGEAEDILGEALDTALAGQRRVLRGRAATFRQSYASQNELVDVCRRQPWLRDRLTVSLELSRGCYWDQCDFCNFNDAYGARFRMHDPQRVLGDMRDLRTAFGQRRFQFLDTALPPRVSTAIEEQRYGDDYEIFCEIRPDFGTERLRRLASLGRVTVQIGVETLDSDHLALMDKRQTVEEGVAMLRAAQELGMGTVWGIMIGHPKETAAHRDRLLAHVRRQRRLGLPAPSYMTECELRPGSGLWDDRRALGLRVRFPWRMFDAVLPPQESSCALVPSRIEGMPHHNPDYRAFRRVLAREVEAWRADQGLG